MGNNLGQLDSQEDENEMDEIFRRIVQPSGKKAHKGGDNMLSSRSTGIQSMKHKEKVKDDDEEDGEPKFAYGSMSLVKQAPQRQGA